MAVYHGKDGTNGSDGKDGMDGVSPELSIRDMGNGLYCWVLNGQILVDANGQPLPVNGKDGADGQDGEDGRDGADGEDGRNGQDGEDGRDGAPAPLPIVKTGSQLISSGVSGSWERDAVYLSVDSGHVWTKISASSTSFFTDVDTTNPSVVKFTLMDGTVLSVMRTDSLFSLIIGEWLHTYNNDIYTFNSDGTYTRRQSSDSSMWVESGTFGLDGTQQHHQYGSNGLAFV